jgi:putative methyltransferase (TIGR04325 family)
MLSRADARHLSATAQDFSAMSRPLTQTFAGAVAGLKKDIKRLQGRHRLYANWADAVQGASYENSDLTAYRYAKAKRFFENRQYERVTTPGFNYLRLCTTWLSAAGRPVEIVDFGGAFGEEGLALVCDPQFRDKVRYTVCESRAVCERASTLDYPKILTFTDDLSSITKCDLFYSSAAFPYIEDVPAILAAAITLRPRLVVLARNCFSERELIRVQASPLFHNGPDVGEIPGFANSTVYYPHHTQDLAATMRQLEGGGYRLLAQFSEDSGVYTYGNEVFGRDLIFIEDALAETPSETCAAS